MSEYVHLLILLLESNGHIYFYWKFFKEGHLLPPKSAHRKHPLVTPWTKTNSLDKRQFKIIIDQKLSKSGEKERWVFLCLAAWHGYDLHWLWKRGWMSGRWDGCVVWWMNVGDMGHQAMTGQTRNSYFPDSRNSFGSDSSSVDGERSSRRMPRTTFRAKGSSKSLLSSSSRTWLQKEEVNLLLFSLLIARMNNKGWWIHNKKPSFPSLSRESSLFASVAFWTRIRHEEETWTSNTISYPFFWLVFPFVKSDPVSA